MPDDRIGEVGNTIAALRAELAQAQAERDEALAQQAAAAEVLQVINASPGDLAPVFEAILEKALRLCEANFGTLMTWDGEHFHRGASRGIPAALLDATIYPIAPAPGGVAERLVRGEKIVSIRDILEYDAYQNSPGLQAVVRLGGARSYLAVTLRKYDKLPGGEDTLLGLLHVYRQEVRPFTDKQIALLQNFAAQAVIAMENARLLTETREGLERQTATSDILRVIAASPGDADGTLRKIAETTMRLFNAAGAAFRIGAGDAYSTAIVVGRGAEDVSTRLSDPDHLVRPRTLPGTVIHENRQIHLPDLDNLDPAFADWPGPPVFRAAGMRTLSGTPLRREGGAFGALVVYRDELRPFDAEELNLLQSFADQAVIAMENARLINETREALEQQTATAEVLRVINSSPGDLAPVFEAMLDKALHLCEASFGYLLTYDGEGLVPVADRGDPAFSAWVREQGKIVPELGTINARIIRDGEAVVQVADVVNDPFYQSDTAMRRAVLEIGGFRTVLTVALRKDDTLLGIIHVYRHEVRPFGERQIALLQNFAAQAVIAMENARLITETREALDQQTATAEVLQVINSSPGELPPVFEAMIDKAMRLCQAELSHFMEFDGERFRTVTLSGAAPSYTKFMSRPLGAGETGGSLAALVRGEAVVHVPDLKGSEAYRSGNPARRALVDLGRARTGIWVALRNEAGLRGALVLYRTEVQPFTDKQIALLQNFAAQAVIAMENARLLGELRQRTDEVAELNRGLEARVAEQLAELGRIGSLKRFLPPQVAEMVVSQGDERILESHRREIVVVFADVRNYTTFTETAEPEEVIEFLGEYHAALGPLITRFEGTLSHFFGDGLMVFFNDPLPCPDPAQRAVNMARAMRETAGELMTAWRRRGHRIGFGVGIAQGYATLGQIGFAERMDYTAIGTVTNLAARLCDAARDGQILISSRIATAVEGAVTLEEMGDQSLKGLSQAVAIYNVMP